MKPTIMYVLGFPEAKKKNYFNNGLKLPKLDSKH